MTSGEFSTDVLGGPHGGLRRGTVVLMTIRLEHPEFHASVADVRHATGSLGQARQRARVQVGLLLDSWHGRAARSFADAWSHWLDAADRLERSLGEVAEVLADVHEQATLVDDTAGDDLDRMRGRLG